MTPSGLCVLLLGGAVEALPAGDALADLLRADGVVAVEPARLSYRAQGRIPAELADALATLQARRLLRALPAPPAVVVVTEPLQYPLARGLLAAVDGCELWYAHGGRPAGASARMTRRLAALEAQASKRAAVTFERDADNAPLWDRLRELAVDVRVSARGASRSAPSEP
jgi:hypothetical protein